MGVLPRRRRVVGRLLASLLRQVTLSGSDPLFRPLVDRWLRLAVGVPRLGAIASVLGSLSLVRGVPRVKWLSCIPRVVAGISWVVGPGSLGSAGGATCSISYAPLIATHSPLFAVLLILTLFAPSLEVRKSLPVALKEVGLAGSDFGSSGLSKKVDGAAKVGDSTTRPGVWRGTVSIKPGVWRLPLGTESRSTG